MSSRGVRTKGEQHININTNRTTNNTQTLTHKHTLNFKTFDGFEIDQQFLETNSWKFKNNLFSPTTNYRSRGVLEFVRTADPLLP
jgi:hypothetical protein